MSVPDDPAHSRRGPADDRIHSAAEGDLAALPAVERAAARLLFDAGAIGAAIAHETTPNSDLLEAWAEGRLFVARPAPVHDPSMAHPPAPVGFALCERLGAGAHLAELGVHPDHARRGLGTALLRRAVEWARAQGHTAITLTTDRLVPFNAPFYERHGFVRLEGDDLTPTLAALLAKEAARGLEPARRVAMLRRLDASAD